MNTSILRYASIVLAAVFVGGYFVYPGISAFSPVTTSAPYKSHTEESSAAYEQLKKATDLSQAFKHVATALKPSVVNINTKVASKNVGVRRFTFPRSPFGNDPMFKQFEQQLRQFEMPMQSPGRQGLGSGFVIGEDGHILTNYHVVKGADEIQVTLSDDETYDASVIGFDAETDLAVLEISVKGLQPIHWGSSDSSEVGEWVVAIGSPFGLSQSVTAGIISAVGRDNVGITSYEDFIQTDAAINPGNSGGPLVNLRGELIGVNTAIASRSGSYNGIGFAIPARIAKRVADSIIENGIVQRGYLGVGIQDLDEDLAKSFGFSRDIGVLIGEVVANGPADNAGILAGDIVTKLDGKTVSDATEFRNAIAEFRPNSVVKLEIYREGKLLTHDVTLGLRDLNKIKSVGVMRSSDSASGLGMSVESIDSNSDAAGKLSGDVGVVVTQVDPAGMAAQVGVRPGDIILSINDNETTSTREFNEVVKSVDLSNGVRMRVYRDGMSRFVFMRKAG